MPKFKDKVIKIVSKIPYGKVMSYGQVAVCAGFPRGARQVGWILNKLSMEIPWWRVVNNEGRISIKGAEYLPIEQKEKLETEGLLINKDLTFNIETYRHIPDPKEFFNPDEDDISTKELEFLDF